MNSQYPGYADEFNSNLAESFELDTDRNQLALQRGEVREKNNVSIENSSSDYTAQNANGSLANKIKINRSRNPKKSISNQSSGIISSFKSWTHSLITHSSRQNCQGRRQRSRNIDATVNMETANTEGHGSISQTENRESNILRTEISDEELARRIQIEELNGIGSFHIMEDSSNLPLYSLGSFRDANYYPNVTVSSSESIAISPFQGVSYKFEFRSSDDEQ
ncbi:unnamed protein product [Cryptosporidium hominis]|uniref:Uncharacterized protein n=1 Tax=Cryptosporidium hominis TaxID=237895 RepID=A0A0S4TJ59_CRYHO|nr:hypothetical protein [Cryptosporidium hominis TU502]PPS93984.1 Uncharacterized protein GY17_00003010 [Cryptosporidium hominis]CUV07279.1 unnamed protein product [Cryptosporidium hominis]|eukprot:PPS93984.1 Uncharacterized protein GY17_00003010 [Cryptosporidium hominis]